ncbi:hypothetical protein STAN_1848 [Streptomyces sp. CBMAI 2042]|uniref:hypothetical protein n=1 Tax=Streptomyces sp. CBMAI 2042 TaxID=2305222 RepID=UPI000F10900F|nr:hypothetical protein [Streptomyces sp. CBMAI 2042]RLV66327.1 hypothetical protein STAN_1848 [Streptomyces sp. CBMAI 2042]
MAEEKSVKAQAQEAIYKEILENAKALEPYRGSGNTSKALLELAEAYAWVTHPAQPH